MSDKTEHLNLALEHTRKISSEINTVADILISEQKTYSAEYDMLDDIYVTLLKVDNRLRKLGAEAKE